MELLEIFQKNSRLNEEFEKQKEQKRRRELDYIYSSGIKPVCENCKHLVKVNKREDVFRCERRRGIIPSEIADNLTCVRNCNVDSGIDFEPNEMLVNNHK